MVPFTLSVPGMGDFSHELAMPKDGTITQPVAGSTLSYGEDLVVEWSGADSIHIESLYLSLYFPNAIGGEGAKDFHTPQPGTTTLTIPAADLRALYKGAGDGGGAANARIVVTRKKPDDVQPAAAPYAMAGANVRRELGVVDFEIVPL